MSASMSRFGHISVTRPQKSLGVGWILSACERDTLAARRAIKNAARESAGTGLKSAAPRRFRTRQMANGKLSTCSFRPTFFGFGAHGRHHFAVEAILEGT